MLLPDVNILVYAYREDAPGHERFRDWLQDLVNGDEAYGLSDLVCSGFLRIVTHPAVFTPPSPIGDALYVVPIRPISRVMDNRRRRMEAGLLLPSAL